MGYAAIVKLPRNFSKIKFIALNQFFYSVDFMEDYKMFNSRALDFRKGIGKIGIVAVQFRAEVI